MSVGIRVIDKSTLKHFAIGSFNAWNEVGWCEGCLLSFSMEVLRVPVKRELSNWNQWAVSLRPDLSNVIHIESVLFGLLKRHNLHKPGPRWEVSFLNVLEEISCSEILIFLTHLSSFCSSEILDTLVSFEMVLDKEWFALFIDPLVSVRTIAIHMTVAIGCSSVREKDHHLMEGLRREGPEIPCHLLLLYTSLRISLLAMDEIWEFDWISDEEHRSVVSNHIIITFFGVEFYREATRVSVTIIGTTFSGYS